MKWKVLVFCFVLTLLALDGVSQKSVFRIYSSDSIAFRVQLDGYPTSDSSLVSCDFVFDSVSHILGNLIINLDSVVPVNFEATLSPGYIEIYELSKMGNQFLVLPFLKTPLSTDSLIVDSLVPLVYDANETFQNTPTIIGCTPPCSQFDDVLSNISAEFFSSRKEKIIAVSLKNNCFWVEQLVLILSEIDYEDKRIDFLDLAYQHAYDLNNFKNLRSLFYLDKYQLMFDEFLESKQDD